jgi:hypothetical protein
MFGQPAIGQLQHLAGSGQLDARRSPVADHDDLSRHGRSIGASGDDRNDISRADPDIIRLRV